MGQRSAEAFGVETRFVPGGRTTTVQACPECGEWAPRNFDSTGRWRTTASGRWMHKHDEFSAVAWVGAEDVPVMPVADHEILLQQQIAEVIRAALATLTKGGTDA